jgi:hypothetical protein
MKVRILDSRPAPSGIGRRLWQAARGQAPPVRVDRQQRPYWQERGWRWEGNRYLGNYQTMYGAYMGMIEQHGRNHFAFYIFDPPEVLRHHHHWVCFQHRGDNRYQVHMGTMPDDVSSGILTIERLITEAFEQ